MAVTEGEVVAAEALAEAALAEGPSGVVAVSTGIDCYSSVYGDGLRPHSDFRSNWFVFIFFWFGVAFAQVYIDIIVLPFRSMNLPGTADCWSLDFVSVAFRLLFV